MLMHSFKHQGADDTRSSLMLAEWLTSIHSSRRALGLSDQKMT